LILCITLNFNDPMFSQSVKNYKQIKQQTKFTLIIILKDLFVAIIILYISLLHVNLGINNQ